MPATSQPEGAKLHNNPKERIWKNIDIKEELKKLPDAPGVYIMHDKDDVIIYIAKPKA